MAQMPFTEHNNMVKTIPSDRTDEPLRCKLRAMTANSAPPNTWKASSGRMAPFARSAATAIPSELRNSQQRIDRI